MSKLAYLLLSINYLFELFEAMKMNLIKPLYGLTLLLILTSLYACKNDDTQPQTRTQMITRNWKVKQVEETVGGTTTTVFQQNASANSVNYAAYRLNFTSAANFTRTDRDNSTVNGNWSFDSSETKINFQGGSKPAEVIIEELNENSLIITYSETDAKGRNKDVRMQLIPA